MFLPFRKQYVIVELNGGLGNQLFQYATGRAVATRLNAQLWLDANFYTAATHRQFDLKDFCISARTLPRNAAKLCNGRSSSNPWVRRAKAVICPHLQRLKDKMNGYNVAIEALAAPCRLNGYWQTEKYFKHIRPLLINELIPNAEQLQADAQLINELSQPNGVAVHIRRGDYITTPQYARVFGIMPDGYYQRAMEQIRDVLGSPTFYVFSEDNLESAAFLNGFNVKWIKPSPARSTAMDLYLMSRCSHFIIANSTFSWWGAWLSTHPNKMVICPLSFHHRAMPWDADLVPPSWTRSDVGPELPESAAGISVEPADLTLLP